MTRKTIENALLVAVAVLLMGRAYMLDADDLRDVGLTDAQLQAQQEARRERAAAQLCIKAYGPGVAPGWTADGRLTCQQHNARRPAVILAQEARP